jgi:pimeloyl-ACP methyl ester carboxylesterase
MKTLIRFLFCAACLGLLVTCSKNKEIFDDESLILKSGGNNVQHAGLDQDRYVTMPGTDLKVHYRIIGKGPIDLVWIPGWTNPLTVYTMQFDYFRDMARSIYIDLPGHGLSDAPEGLEYTTDLMAEAIYSVVKKEGLKKFTAVGFSWGPVQLTRFNKNHPGMIQKLVNIDGIYSPWPTEEPARTSFINDLNLFLDWIQIWTVEDKSGGIPESAPEELKAWATYFPTFPNWLMYNMYLYYSSEESSQPAGWNIPILSIYVAPYDQTLEGLMFPNSVVRIIEESGHVVQWEKHELVNPLIKDFVLDRPGKKY